MIECREVVDYKPAGSYILVELLESQEVLNTRISVSAATKIETQQAYILAFGPSLDVSKFGVKVGDRVAISGGFVPLPKLPDERQKGVMDVSSIRAVLVEGENPQKKPFNLVVS